VVLAFESNCKLGKHIWRVCSRLTDDFGAEFATHSDSLAYRTIGIYVFLRTVMCSPVRASQIAHALKLPRVAVLRRLQEMVKHGYVERVGNGLSRYGQGEHPRPAEEIAAANRHGRRERQAAELGEWGLTESPGRSPNGSGC
jgi:hypothetical protein